MYHTHLSEVINCEQSIFIVPTCGVHSHSPRIRSLLCGLEDSKMNCFGLQNLTLIKLFQSFPYYSGSYHCWSCFQLYPLGNDITGRTSVQGEFLKCRFFAESPKKYCRATKQAISAKSPQSFHLSFVWIKVFMEIIFSTPVFRCYSWCIWVDSLDMEILQVGRIANKKSKTYGLKLKCYKNNKYTYIILINSNNAN